MINCWIVLRTQCDRLEKRQTNRIANAFYGSETSLGLGWNRKQSLAITDAPRSAWRDWSTCVYSLPMFTSVQILCCAFRRRSKLLSTYQFQEHRSKSTKTKQNKIALFYFGNVHHHWSFPFIHKQLCEFHPPFENDFFSQFKGLLWPENSVHCNQGPALSITIRLPFVCHPSHQCHNNHAIISPKFKTIK